MSPFRIIDEMPSLSKVEDATSYEIVCLHHYLRPTMMNEELIIVKAIARRYDAMNSETRSNLVARARREYEL